jgi:peptidylprolyl isomerase
LAKNAVSEDDRVATEQAHLGGIVVADPMQGLDELDVAGPKPE